MSRSKTDYSKLKTLGQALEEYAETNFFEIKRCTEFQWNVRNSITGVLLSVYPGSGLLYCTHAHFEHTGLLDQTGKKYYFTNKKAMLTALNKLLFATDTI